METKLWRCFTPSRSIWLVLVVVLASVTAESYDRLCTVADNPLNVPFTVPSEKLVDGRYAEVHSIGINLIDPRDFGCKANYDDVKESMFKGALKCDIADTHVVCEVGPSCTAQRRKSLQRLRKAVLKTLDEVVIKTKAIKFFNEYVGAKHLLFGAEPLEKLTGLEILERATTGRINMLKGFSVESKHPKPPRTQFDNIFRQPVDLYGRLYAAEEPTGLLKTQKCKRTAQKPESGLIDNEIFSCAQTFFDDIKRNTNLAEGDAKLVELLEKAFKYIVHELSDGKKSFRGLKIPFLGECIDSKGIEANPGFLNLVKSAYFLYYMQ